MKKPGALILVALLFMEVAYAGVGGSDTVYVGGTIPNLKEKIKGKSSTADDKDFVFQAKAGSVRIPYDKIESLEYGQKAGRRVGMAVAISPLFLFSKKRRHYLTINYTDQDGKQQAGVFEIWFLHFFSRRSRHYGRVWAVKRPCM